LIPGRIDYTAVEERPFRAAFSAAFEEAFSPGGRFSQGLKPIEFYDPYARR